MPAIHLVRHGQASFGTADYDVLSDLGGEQAVLVQAEVARRGIEPSTIVSGALRRQIGTAQPWIDAGAEHVVDPRWDEYDSEALVPMNQEGLTSRDFQGFLDTALTNWAQGGPGYAEFRDRCLGAFEDTAAAGETAVVVTSGGVIGLLAAHALGLEDTAMVAFNRVTVNAAITTFVVGRSGTSLVTFNEHGYLPRSHVTYR